MLGALVTRQAYLGDVDGAETALDAVDDAWREEVILSMMDARAKQGKVGEAVAIASELSEQGARQRAWTRLAPALARHASFDLAMRMIEENRGSSNVDRARTYAAAAREYLGAGKRHQFEQANGRAITAERNCRAQGQSPGTKNTPADAGALVYAVNLAAIAGLQAKARDLPGAAETADRIPSGAARENAYVALAKAQVSSGNYNAARFIARNHLEPSGANEVYTCIAEAFIGAGKLGDARKLIRLIRPSTSRPEAVRRLAEARIRQGQAKGLEEWIRSLPKASERAHACIGAATGLLKLSYEAKPIRRVQNDDGPTRRNAHD